MRRLALFGFLCMLNLAVYAVDAPFKFGKIEISEFQTNLCPIDSNAEAYYIGDYGETRFDFVSSSVVYERHYRIKIINKKGYDYSSIKIRLNRNASISGLKGLTYNLENGKIEKTELNNKNKVEEKINEYSKSLNFAMPNVKEGSIIEIKYKIYYESYGIPGWFFQQTIPVIESRYVVSIPDFFYYKKLSKGYLAVNYTTSKENNSINGFSYTENVENYLCHHAPALKDEPYVDCLDNYRSGLDYELASYQFPGRMIQNFNTTYESINKTLLDDEDFYLQLNTLLFLSDEIDSINKNFDSPEKKMNAAYQFVQSRMKWDERNRMYVSESLRKAYKEHSGSSADINMLLTFMLRKLGLNAEPVILSTRDNGMLFQAQAMITAFNYVIVNVDIAGKKYLLDATEKYCPMGMLPPRCLNNEGRIISEKSFGWVKLNTNNNFKENQTLQLTLDSIGDLRGSLKITSREYAALNFRDDYSGYTNKDEFIKHIESNITGLKINSLQIDDLDSLNKPVTQTYNIELTSKGDVQGDMIYFNPMLFEKIESNPFKLEERKFPVDYNYPKDETYTLMLTIPEGYKVEEMPKPAIFGMSGNAAKFTYNVVLSNNIVILTCRRQINKQLFQTEEYSNLKEYYNQIVAKQSEMLVLKRQ